MSKIWSLAFLFCAMMTGLPAQVLIKETSGIHLSASLDYLGMLTINQDSPSRVDARSYQGWSSGFLAPTVALDWEFNSFYLSGSLGIPLQLDSKFQQWEKKWTGSNIGYDEKVVYSQLASSGVKNSFSLLADLRFAYALPLNLATERISILQNNDALLLGVRLAYSTYGGDLLKVVGADYVGGAPIDYSDEENTLRVHLLRPMLLVGLKLDRGDTPFSGSVFGGLGPFAFYDSTWEINGQTTNSNSILALNAMLEGVGSYRVSDAFSVYARVAFDGILGGKGKQDTTEDNYLVFGELKMGLGITLTLAGPQRQVELGL